MCKILLAILTVSFGYSLFSMDLEGCLQLKSYYLEKDSAVEQKINEIDQQIKQNPGDPYLVLAKTTLLTIMASNSTIPDATLALRMNTNVAHFLNMAPANPFGIIYQGAALAYQAKANHYLFDQISLINQASANFDRGLKLMVGTQYEWWARSMRGASYAQFPLALGKRETAMNDLLFVENAYAENPSLIGEAIVAFYYLGELNASLGKRDVAMTYWRRAASLNHGSPLSEGQKAERRIK